MEFKLKITKERKRNDEGRMEGAIGLCACGKNVWLERFTNTCDCGKDYNMEGQLLAPREQWGEETGETWHDIIDL